MHARRQRITIIGTGCVGASIGLAIRESKDAEHLEVVGHDREHSRARLAEKAGAFDRITLNLSVALDAAQLVILAVPLAALRETLQEVGTLIPPDTGTVITDTAPLKVPARAWAEAALPSGAYYVGGDPFLAPGAQGWEPLRGVADASADLFADAIYAVVAPSDAHPSAVRTVMNLAVTLGATPLLMDPDEHDAVRLMADTVPGLVAVALFQMAAEDTGWGEIRRAAGRTLATATAGASGDVPSRRMAALLGRETVLRGLDAVQAQLAALRNSVAEGDAEALDAMLAAAMEGRRLWMAQSRLRTWQVSEQTMSDESLFDRTLQSLLGEGVIGKRKE